MELEFNEGFYAKVREQFGLGTFETPTDEHVRMFIWGACKTAFDKAEREMRADGSWKDGD